MKRPSRAVRAKSALGEAKKNLEKPQGRRAPAPSALGAAGNAAIGRAIETQRGEPVPEKVQERVEESSGVALDDARVVAGEKGDVTAKAAGAEAVTTGDTIYVARDAPPLSSPAGEQLLSHELIHVAQQRRATRVETDRIGAPGGAHERAADVGAAAAKQGTSMPVASASSPGVQRQSKPTIDGRKTAIQAYFERVQKSQGGTGVTLTPAVRDAVRRIFAKDRLAYSFAADSLDRAAALSTKPADLAAALARSLSEQIDITDLAFLDALPGDTEAKGRAGRLGDLAEKSAPYKTPDSQQAEWKFNYDAGQLRKGQGGIDPISVDVLQLGRILHGLPGAWKGPPPKSAQVPQARPVPALDKALESVATDALVPSTVRGTDAAGEYADAQEVARGLAASLDVAHQRNMPSVDILLGANYEKVKDPAAILAAVERIVGIVKGALPHHAPGIVVKVYFGNKLVRTFTLVRSE